MTSTKNLTNQHNRPKLKNKTAIAENLLAWFADNKRDLPFRQVDKNGHKDPYAVWISEIMAQQTQIATLLPYYERFTKRFPDVQTLAAADEAEVLKYWAGLGYYSRARNLHKAARTIMADFGGYFPGNMKDIERLPGIGPYTAGAIGSIAFGLPVPAVDGNVMRVITRLTDWDIDIADGHAKAAIGDVVTEIQPKDRPGDFNEALMELGALVCTPEEDPACLVCPWRDDCAARAHGTIAARPVKTKKQKNKKIPAEVGIFVNQQNEIYLEKRPEKGLLAGMWGFPIVEIKNKKASPGTAIAAFGATHFDGFDAASMVPLGKAKHVFTHRTWQMQVYRFDVTGMKQPPDNAVFATKKAIDSDFALPTAFKKILKLI